MKPGRFDEQPMPETTSTLWGGIPSSTMASLSDFRTPKSPQAGHQRVTAVDGAGVPADDEEALRGPVGPAHELHFPDRLAVARPGRLSQPPRPRLFLHVDAD